MKTIRQFIDKQRFKLLLAFTMVFLIAPAFFEQGPVMRLVMILALTFVFLQSLYIVTERHKRHLWVYILFLAVLVFNWLGVLDQESQILSFFRTLFYFAFFVMTIFSMTRHIVKAQKVTVDVITVSVVNYLLIGVLAGSAAMFFYDYYPGSYHFAYPGDQNSLIQMTYYAFITMTTVGYGDIVPAIPETQTFAYLLAVTGQLYIAILIAFIMGKFIVHQGSERIEG